MGVGTNSEVAVEGDFGQNSSLNIINPSTELELISSDEPDDSDEESSNDVRGYPYGPSPFVGTLPNLEE